MRTWLIKLLLVISVAAVWIPVRTNAAEPIAGGSYKTTMVWTLDADGTLTISGSGTIDDYKKGKLTQPWMEYKSAITALVIEDGITRIGDRAFQSCKYLEHASIGKDVASIGEWAFQNCYALTSVSLSPDVTIENGAFRGTPAEPEVRAVESPLYTGSRFYSALSQTVLTGDYRDDIIRIALSQEGYHEGDSKADYAGGNLNGSDNYTEYGRYMNSQGRAWCSEFAVWCIRMAGVPRQIVADSCSANASTFTKDASAAWYDWSKTVWSGGSYTPRKGDILLWAWDTDSHSTDEDLSHTALLIDIETQSDGTILLHTIDGNSSDQVKQCTYRVNVTDGTLTERTGRLCYIVSPDYESSKTETVCVCFAVNGSTTAEKLAAKDGLYGVLPVPQRTDDTFLGWYTDPIGGVRINPYKPVTKTEDHTLYARWGSGDGFTYGSFGENKELHWSFDRDAGTITVSGAVCAQHPIYAAGYDDDGKMCWVHRIDSSGQQAAVNKICAYIKLFWVDDCGRPKCRNVAITYAMAA